MVSNGIQRFTTMPVYPLYLALIGESGLPRSEKRTCLMWRCRERRCCAYERGRRCFITTTSVSATGTRVDGIDSRGDLVHVGKYDLSVKRRTLHGCYGCPPEGDTTRARNILQHDLAYTRDLDFRDSLPDSLRPMVDKLNGMQADLDGQHVGYSQDG